MIDKIIMYETNIKKNPKETPEIAYLPKAHSLTLGFMETFDTEFLKSRAVVFKE